MFRRGQRIIVIESSAKKGAHPEKGDIGYLDNLYLFPYNQFILMDALFFRYKSDIKKNVTRKVEKKRLIINLGMKSELLSDIVKNGVTRQFFSDLVPVCLTSVGYVYNAFIDHPYFIGPCGMWSRDSRMMANGNAIVRIPYGNIAPFNNSSNRKYLLGDCDNKELSAWLRTMNPMMAFMWSVFFNLGDCDMNNSISNAAEVIWLEVNKYLTTNAVPNGTKYKFNNMFLALNSDEKNHIIEQIRKLEALDTIALHRQDIGFLNNTSDNRRGIQQLAELWQSYGMVTLWNKGSALSPQTKRSIAALRSIFFRSVIMSDDVRSKLKMFSKYFPYIDINNSRNISIFQSIQKDINNSSAALARIFDSSLVSKR